MGLETYSSTHASERSEMWSIHLAFCDNLTSFNELFKVKRMIFELVMALLVQLYWELELDFNKSLVPH